MKAILLAMFVMSEGTHSMYHVYDTAAECVQARDTYQAKWDADDAVTSGVVGCLPFDPQNPAAEGRPPTSQEHEESAPHRPKPGAV